MTSGVRHVAGVVGFAERAYELGFGAGLDTVEDMDLQLDDLRVMICYGPASL